MPIERARPIVGEEGAGARGGAKTFLPARDQAAHLADLAEQLQVAYVGFIDDSVDAPGRFARDLAHMHYFQHLPREGSGEVAPGGRGSAVLFHELLQQNARVLEIRCARQLRELQIRAQPQRSVGFFPVGLDELGEEPVARHLFVISG